MYKLSNKYDIIKPIRSELTIRKDNGEPLLPYEIISQILVTASDDRLHQRWAFLATATCRSTYYLRRKLILSIPSLSMEEASRRGLIDLLDWWKKDSGLSRKELEARYTAKSITYAAENGRVDVLQWWKSSGLAFKYNSEALLRAATRDILDWWKRNKMPFHCDKSPVDVAVTSGKWDIIDWWFKCSELPVTFTCSPMIFVHKKLLQI